MEHSYKVSHFVYAKLAWLKERKTWLHFSLGAVAAMLLMAVFGKFMGIREIALDGGGGTLTGMLGVGLWIAFLVRERLMDKRLAAEAAEMTLEERSAAFDKVREVDPNFV